MKLPLVAGNNTILVVCNRLSKMVYFMAAVVATTSQKTNSNTSNKSQVST